MNSSFDMLLNCCSTDGGNMQTQTSKTDPCGLSDSQVMVIASAVCFSYRSLFHLFMVGLTKNDRQSEKKKKALSPA